jgi:hypothetical protein
MSVSFLQQNRNKGVIMVRSSLILCSLSAIACLTLTPAAHAGAGAELLQDVGADGTAPGGTCYCPTQATKSGIVSMYSSSMTDAACEGGRVAKVFESKGMKITNSCKFVSGAK